MILSGADYPGNRLLILWIEESYRVTIQTDPLQQYFHNAQYFTK